MESAAGPFVFEDASRALHVGVVANGAPPRLVETAVGGAPWLRNVRQR